MLRPRSIKEGLARGIPEHVTVERTRLDGRPTTIVGYRMKQAALPATPVIAAPPGREGKEGAAESLGFLRAGKEATPSLGSAQLERDQPIGLGESLCELLNDRSEDLGIERLPLIHEPRRLVEALRVRQHVSCRPYLLARPVFEGFHRDRISGSRDAPAYREQWVRLPKATVRGT